MSKVEIVKNRNKTYALVIRYKNQFTKKGVNFLTKNQDLLQVGFINHPKNHIIKSHIHKKNIRKINYCTEVLIIIEGKVRVKFYNEKGKKIKIEKNLNKGDIIILFKGGHGFEVLKKAKIIETRTILGNKR